jgi:Skp family chaperone for outer membrane proteins
MLRKMTLPLALCGIIAIAAIAVYGFDVHAISVLAASPLAIADVGAAAALEKEMKDLAGLLKTAADDVKKKGDTLQTEMKSLGEATAETKKAVDDALLKHNDLASKQTELTTKFGEAVGRIVEIEQTLAQRRQDNEPAQQVDGRDVRRKRAVQGFNGKGAIRVQMNRADITNVTGTVGSNTSPANSLVGACACPASSRRPSEADHPRPDRARPDQPGHGRVCAGDRLHQQRRGRDRRFDQAEVRSDVRTEERAGAHHRALFKASRQILDDAPALRSYIDARARYGLRLTEEANCSTATAPAPTSRAWCRARRRSTPRSCRPRSRPTSTRSAWRSCRCSSPNFPASGIVLHPTDWAAIQLTKDSQALHHRQSAGRQHAAAVESAGRGNASR